MSSAVKDQLQQMSTTCDSLLLELNVSRSTPNSTGFSPPLVLLLLSLFRARTVR
jgi:hypothetical protein